MKETNMTKEDLQRWLQKLEIIKAQAIQTNQGSEVLKITDELIADTKELLSQCKEK
jgi:arsenate reductase-like glutaredoxin family protein